MSEADFKLMNDMAYWLEGVIQTGKQLNMFNKIVMIEFLLYVYVYYQNYISIILIVNSCGSWRNSWKCRFLLYSISTGNAKLLQFATCHVVRIRHILFAFCNLGQLQEVL